MYLSEVMSPTHDFSFTWRMRGGLSGHGDPKARLNLMSNLTRETFKIIQELLKEKTGSNNISLVIQATQFLKEHYGNTSRSLHNLLGGPIDLNYTLVTGYSRAGGTYLIDEIAKTDGVDIQKRHLCFSHDHSPTFNSNWKWPTSTAVNDELMQYLAALCVYTHLTHEPLYKRSVIGAKILPHALLKLHANIGSLNLNWIHAIRDFPSSHRSLKKMYSMHPLGIEAVQFENHTGLLEDKIDPALLSLSAWFISNLYVLPIQDGLPFVSIPISWKDQRPEEVLKLVVSTIDRYLKNNPKTLSPYIIKPVVIKYEDIPSYINNLATTKGGAHVPDQFNIKSKAEMDCEASQGIYIELCKQLNRLYSYYEIDFPL